jgi:hypothetical protein
MTDARTPRNLQVRRSRGRMVALVVAVAAAAAAFAVWFVTHPPALPAPDEPVDVSVPLFQPVYVGVYDGDGTDRTLHISEVSLDVEGEATVALMVCRDGAVSVTSEPTAFCTSLDDANGATIEPGDALVLEISEDESGEATIHPAEVSYRDGIRWGTQPVGPTVEATFVSR